MTTQAGWIVFGERYTAEGWVAWSHKIDDRNVIRQLRAATSERERMDIAVAAYDSGSGGVWAGKTTVRSVEPRQWED